MYKKLFVLLAMLFLIAGYAGKKLTAQSHSTQAGIPEGNFVVRVYYEEIYDIGPLATQYDVWEFNNIQEKYVLVGVNQDSYKKLLQEEWKLEIAVEETALLNNASLQKFYAGYRTVDEIYADLAEISTDNPTIAELIDYGDSYCKLQDGCQTLGGEEQAGYDLLALKISHKTKYTETKKPALFLMASIHPREITTPEIAMRMADWLIDGYGTNADATWLVDHHEVWIVPFANPDAHWIVELGEEAPYLGVPFYQRKNANQELPCAFWPPAANIQYGVDLNRNHSFGWGNAGTVGCSMSYQGNAAASEPETGAIETLIKDIFPDQRGPGLAAAAPVTTTGILITLHSYSELVLYPWGHTTSPAPNEGGLRRISDKFATYNGYTSCQPSVCLYTASGTSDDFAYGALGIPAFTFELGRQFMPRYSDVDNEQWPLNGPALQYAAKIARQPYASAEGPDSLNLNTSITNTSIPQGATVDVAALIDDSGNGFQTIQAAEFYIDTPFWVTTTTPISMPMEAVGTSFGSDSGQVVKASLDTTDLSLGTHMLFVRGQDNAGNWGPVSSMFIEITDDPVPPPTFEYYFPLIHKN